MAFVIARLSAVALLAIAGIARGDEARSVLANPDQIALDLRAAEILKLPEIQAEKPSLRALYEADPQAATPDGKARLEKPLDAVMFASVLNAVAGDPARPKIVWDAAAPHRWRGVTIPASGYGFDNPDNVYRQVAIDGAARYEITGRVAPDGPAQESFALYRSLPGSSNGGAKAVREGSPVLGALTVRDLQKAADGSFTITIDHDPADGRANHIQSGDSPDEILIVRDTLSDWASQRPGAVSVRRVGGPAPGPEPTQAGIVRRAIELMRAMVPFWLKYDRDFVFSLPVNAVQAPQKRDGGWGYGAMGRFDLAPDEAMIVTVEPLGARYVGFQIADLWSVAPDYVRRQSSLNNHQARPDADGAFTYVIAATDPGSPNWVDTVGMHAGMLLVRWQELADRSVPADKAVRAVRIVKLKDLATALPETTARISPDRRRDLLKLRAASYERRLFENESPVSK
jgi:hypothetical protein